MMRKHHTYDAQTPYLWMRKYHTYAILMTELELMATELGPEEKGCLQEQTKLLFIVSLLTRVSPFLFLWLYSL